MLVLSGKLFKIVDDTQVPRVGKVTAWPEMRPMLVHVSGDWLEESITSRRTATIASDGTFSIKLPWPSETNYPNPGSYWFVQLDDKTLLKGYVPEGLATATIDDLVTRYGWEQIPLPASTKVAVFIGGGTGGGGGLDVP